MLKGYIRSKPDIKISQQEMMKQILAQCSGLGPVNDPKVSECEMRIRKTYE